jgi:hypothetical protein
MHPCKEIKPSVCLSVDGYINRQVGFILTYDKQYQQGRAVLNERNPHATQQQNNRQGAQQDQNTNRAEGSKDGLNILMIYNKNSENLQWNKETKFYLYQLLHNLHS